MQIFLFLISGFRKTFRYWNVIILLTVIQLLFSWFFALPMIEAFDQQWSSSLLPSQMADHGMMPSLAVSELFINVSQQMSNHYSSGLFIAVGLFYLIVCMFVLAGSLPLYSGLDLKFNWERFLSDGARLFRPFLGLAVISVLFFVLADLISASVNEVVHQSMADSNDEASMFIIGVLFNTLLRYFLFSMVVMIFMQAKICSASEQLRNVIYVIRRAVSFVIKHLLSVLSLFLLVALLEFLIVMLDVSIWHYMLAESSFVVQLVWLVFSTMLLVTIKLLYFASQSQLYNETKRIENDASSIKEFGRSDSSYTTSSRLEEGL